MYYIGLDVHKKTISYCVKDASGQVHQEGKVGATRWELDDWIKDSSSALDRGDGSNDFHRLDLRSPTSTRAAGEGSASADAARHRCGQEEERSDRCRQDRRLLALRLPTGVPHGLHRHSRPTPNPALSPPAGAPDGADEESHLRSADGNGSESQQTAPAQSWVFPRATREQRRGE